MARNEPRKGLKPPTKARGARASTGSARTEISDPFAPSEVEGRAADAPERSCILTRTHGQRGELIRLALSPDGVVAVDVRAKAAGRGAWIGVDRPTLQAALDKGRLRGALLRAFKTQTVEVPADLPAQIEAALAQDALNRLGLEARGGTLATGGERIAEQARAGRVHLLLHAADAATDGRRKLDQAWRVGLDEEGSGRQGVPIPAERTTLSLALGRDNVVSVGVIDRAAAERVGRAVERWRRYIGPNVDLGSCGIDAGVVPLTGNLTESTGE